MSGVGEGMVAMRREHYDETSLRLLWEDEADPQCGDFCDKCGDCLRCYGEDPCAASPDGEHRWVVYEEGFHVRVDVVRGRLP